MENIYYLITHFLIYSFLGWVLEENYSFAKKGIFINRGFFQGPWCPIYGVGALIILYFLYPLENNIPLLFAASLILTSLLEFFTGLVLKKIYNTRWWDYSDRRFNIKGYVCLECSIVWGVIGVLLVKVLNPVVSELVMLLPLHMGITAVIVFSAIFVIDCITTVISLNRLCLKTDNFDSYIKDYRETSNLHV